MVRDLRELPPSVRKKLSKITIVGMKYYNGAYQYLAAAAQRPTLQQRLFLVPDVGNKFDSNAVMIHDGVRKLGHVAAGEAAFIRKWIDEKSVDLGYDVVIVVSLGSGISRIEWASSLTVAAVGFCYERLARKYGQASDKKLQKVLDPDTLEVDSVVNPRVPTSAKKQVNALKALNTLRKAISDSEDPEGFTPDDEYW